MLELNKLNETQGIRKSFNICPKQTELVMHPTDMLIKNVILEFHLTPPHTYLVKIDAKDQAVLNLALTTLNGIRICTISTIGEILS